MAPRAAKPSARCPAERGGREAELATGIPCVRGASTLCAYK